MTTRERSTLADPSRVAAPDAQHAAVVADARLPAPAPVRRPSATRKLSLPASSAAARASAERSGTSRACTPRDRHDSLPDYAASPECSIFRVATDSRVRVARRAELLRAAGLTFESFPPRSTNGRLTVRRPRPTSSVLRVRRRRRRCVRSLLLGDPRCGHDRRHRRSDARQAGRRS